jgi:hypothetical protein
MTIKAAPTTTTEIMLTLDEQATFEEMIDAAIIARYEGDLERREDCDRKGVFTGYYYTPLDPTNIRELLTELWGTIITVEAIEDAFVRLTNDGAAEWPKAYCEDDIEEERLRKLDWEDQGAADKEAHEEHLRWTEAHFDFLRQLEQWLYANGFRQTQHEEKHHG